MKSKFVRYYMGIAEETSKLSYAVRLKVGSILVKDDRILAFGYNGTPSNWDNTCEDYVDGALVTKPEVLHSEMNTLMKIARSNESSFGSVMFCTHAPCIECAKAIYQAGITTLYYKNEYRNTAGVDFLRKSNIEVVRFESTV